DHLLRAGARYHERRGNHFAAAITFFSVLNAIPLLMIAYATAGYVLAGNPALLDALDAATARAVPPELAERIEPVVAAAVGPPCSARSRRAPAARGSAGSCSPRSGGRAPTGRRSPAWSRRCL